MKWLDDGIPKSGRRGIWVYYMFHGKQRRRRYVKPRDPRTSGQQHSRADFRATSSAYSKRLTEQQRENCRRHGAKLKTRVRLLQSGPLTGQHYYIRRARARAKSISGLALEPRQGKDARRPARGLRVVPISQASKSQRVTRSAPKSGRARIGGPRGQSRRARGYARKAGARISAS